MIRVNVSFCYKWRDAHYNLTCLEHFDNRTRCVMCYFCGSCRVRMEHLGLQAIRAHQVPLVLMDWRGRKETGVIEDWMALEALKATGYVSYSIAFCNSQWRFSVRSFYIVLFLEKNWDCLCFVLRFLFNKTGFWFLVRNIIVRAMYVINVCIFVHC